MERLGRARIVLAVCAIVAGLSPVAQSKIIYVDDDAIGTGDGPSWSDALTYLQDALAVASRGDEIRVAQGVYTPDQGAGVVVGDREAMFSLVSGVVLAGGYAGLAGADADARDIALYETVLSGDLKGDDGPDFDNIGDNSQNVVSSFGNGATTVLEGFTVTGGWGQGGPGITCIVSSLLIEDCIIVGNKTKGAMEDGGGMYNSGGSPTLRNCVFRGNLAWGSGGGIANRDGDPVLSDCLFEGNSAERAGGGLYSGRGIVMLERCTFRGNSGRDGGGMQASTGSGSICIDCQFIGNVASSSGPICSSGGGARVTGTMTYRDCLFESNSADEGGGLDSDGDVTLVGCMFRQNSAWDDGGGIINNNGAALVLKRCRFTRNEAGRGGALSSRYSAPTLTDCVFEDNVTKRGGGAVYTVGRLPGRGGGGSTDIAPKLVNCRFTGNRAIRSVGGGLYNDNNETMLTNCLFAGNAADDGGGVYSQGAGPILVRCTLAHNRGGLGGAVSDETGDTALSHCIVWGNDGSQILGVFWASRSDIQGGWGDQSYLDVDPLFAAPGHWDPNGTPDSLSDDFWVDGDYHLRSRGGRWDPASAGWVQDEVTSPCIDAGNPDSDVRDEPFPNGGIINLGAYGGTIEASRTDLGDPP